MGGLDDQDAGDSRAGLPWERSWWLHWGSDCALQWRSLANLPNHSVVLRSGVEGIPPPTDSFSLSARPFEDGRPLRCFVGFPIFGSALLRSER